MYDSAHVASLHSCTVVIYLEQIALVLSSELFPPLRCTLEPCALDCSTELVPTVLICKRLIQVIM
jgi:hypothetical protein